MSKRSISSLLVIVVLIFLAFLTAQERRPVSGLHWSSFDSPVLTPLVTPEPTATSVPETQLVLEFVSERENVPVEQLVVVNQYQRDYEMLGKSFWSVTLLDTQHDGAGAWHRVLVDLADGSVVDDAEAIEQAERAAHRARYGKLEPALFERLQASAPGDEIPVVVWVAGSPRRSDAELYAALAAKYPEARAGMERSGSPFDVGDLELIHEIENEYVRMIKTDTSERIQSLVSYLEEQGYAVKVLNGLSAVAVTLPKGAIQELVQRSDVGSVYLDEDEAQPQLSSAVPSDRAPAAWGRTFSAWGKLVAVAVVWGLALPLAYLSRRARGAAGTRLSWVVLVTATVLTLLCA
jgi:hypothetical protein